MDLTLPTDFESVFLQDWAEGESSGDEDYEGNEEKPAMIANAMKNNFKFDTTAFSQICGTTFNDFAGNSTILNQNNIGSSIINTSINQKDSSIESYNEKHNNCIGYSQNDNSLKQIEQLISDSIPDQNNFSPFWPSQAEIDLLHSQNEQSISAKGIDYSISSKKPHISPQNFGEETNVNDKICFIQGNAEVYERASQKPVQHFPKYMHTSHNQECSISAKTELDTDKLKNASNDVTIDDHCMSGSITEKQCVLRTLALETVKCAQDVQFSSCSTDERQQQDVGKNLVTHKMGAVNNLSEALSTFECSNKHEFNLYQNAVQVMIERQKAAANLNSSAAYEDSSQPSQNQLLSSTTTSHSSNVNSPMHVWQLKPLEKGNEKQYCLANNLVSSKKSRKDESMRECDNGNNQELKSQPQGAAPPFLLFDAPCELRHNFNKAKLEMGLPALKDNNSYHYGMAINGFHPQLNAMDNPPILWDARHDKNRQGESSSRVLSEPKSTYFKERNEKEQRRAQKITELIEELRLRMIKGGWKVEMKSKFNTLSTCSEYVKHLIQSTKEKEHAVNQAKEDLQTKQKKLEEERGIGGTRWDQESVASSLTSSSTIRESLLSSASSNVAAESSQVTNKRRRLMSDASPGTKQEVSRNVDGCVEHNNLEVESEEMFADIKERMVERGNDGLSVLEEAANYVARARDYIKERNGCKKIKIDYEEVFMTSNLPQIISTTAGRIVKWNKIFLQVTGLSKAEMNYLTIFSIVKSDQLSSLFEMVAMALREANTTASEMESVNTASTSTPSYVDTSKYVVVTLPCTLLPLKPRDGTVPRKQLHMTVTLLNDEDPDKRIFHCVFTDSPGTKGKIGLLTTKLIHQLYSEDVKNAKTPKHSLSDVTAMNKTS